MYVIDEQKKEKLKLLADRQVIADEDDNQMSRNFSHPRAGDFCIQIDVERGVRMVFIYQLLNLQDNKVLRQRLVNKPARFGFID